LGTKPRLTDEIINKERESQLPTLVIKKGFYFDKKIKLLKFTARFCGSIVHQQLNTKLVIHNF